VIKSGIEYEKPKVYLLQESGIGVAEFAGRTAYDSFENSENECIKNLNNRLSYDKCDIYKQDLEQVNNIESSELLHSLSWVYHHESVIEHVSLSYLIKGTSRGVLQEHSRHRIQSITVRSTRYTMSSIINAFVASLSSLEGREWFIKTCLPLDMFVTNDKGYNTMLLNGIYDKLLYQLCELGDTEFIKIAVAKSSIDKIYNKEPERTFDLLQNGKKKRNVGDSFKHIVDDNWKVDMVVTFNLRSLKNYFDLRDSGAAYFQIQWLAEEMKKVTPIKYLRLIDKEYKDK